MSKKKLTKPRKLGLYKVLRTYAVPAEVQVIDYSKKEALKKVQDRWGKAKSEKVLKLILKPRILY